MRRRVVAAVVAAVALAAGVGAASSLPLGAGTLETETLAHPCPGTAAVSASGSSVTVTLPSSACAGRTATLTLASSAGAVVASASGTLAGASTTLTMPTLGASTAALVVDGWHVGTTLAIAPSGPITPGNASTTLGAVTWTLISNNPTQACVVVDVTTTSATPVTWAVDVDMTQAPFNGDAPSGLQVQGSDSWRYKVSPNVPSAGRARLTGTTNGGRATVVSGTTYSVTLCDWGLPAGVDTPSAYTVSTTQGTWTPTLACLVTTVTGNGTSPFYVGWTATVDMAPAVAYLTSTGHVRDAWSYGGTEWSVVRTSTGPTTFSVTSTGPSTIAGTQSFSFTTCAVDW